jgi:predicted acylesterase/phospholipase RssA
VTPARTVDHGTSIATCFGGGGAFGIAFNLGVAHGLARAGLPVDRGAMIGTSAGAYAAAALTQGTSLDEIAEAWAAVGRLGPRPAVIRAIRPLFGDARDSRVGGVACILPTHRRRILSGERYPLADVVAASSSPLGMAAPHRIGRECYVDAGMIWLTSVDLAPAADVLVVVAPLAGRRMGKMGRFGEMQIGRELRTWRRRADGVVLYVRPDSITASHAGGRSGLLDMSRAASTYAAASELGVRCAARFWERHP